jgi:hypothetical protein
MVSTAALTILSGAIILSATTYISAQVSPNEIANPWAKATEEKYISQLTSLHQSIETTRFSYPFKLTRYLNAKPGQKGAPDSAGIEFVEFQGQMVLKLSGYYRAEFNASQLSRNQRASQVFQEAVFPILRIITQQVPKANEYDSIGFEIIYDLHDNSKGYEREGKEVLTVVFSQEDAFAYSGLGASTERQRILNHSDIFVNGEAFGLALGQRDPLIVETLDRPARRQAEDATVSAQSSASQIDLASGASISAAVSVTHAVPSTQPTPTFADAMRLQRAFQAQLNAIATEDGAKLHLADVTPPTFEVAGDQTLLHFTLKNTLTFDRVTTSIYKRAAMSFDLFLAPELRSISRRVPLDQGYNALEFSVLGHSAIEQVSNETIDYICPLDSLRSFVANKITTQDLINQSVVLVNGVRITLNLQLVE